jgi:phosphinothricin acetyltransferase
LLTHLIAGSEEEGYWTLQAQIISENDASIALHHKCGFRTVGYRERFGHVQGIWRNVVLMERRSSRTGGPNLPTRDCG